MGTGISEPFALESHFKRIAAPKGNFLDIRCRLGFQVVLKENKRLLDYSELMTRLLAGSGGKFSDFIAQYIDGHIENTQDQVDRQYKEQYPVKSPKRYISDIPLFLNACEALNLHGQAASIEICTTAIPDSLVKLVETGLSIFKRTIPVHLLTPQDLAGSYVKRLFKKPPDEKERTELINSLKSLQYAGILGDIARLKEAPPESITLGDIAAGLDDLRTALALRKHKDIIREYRSIGSNREKPVSDIYQTLNHVAPLLNDIDTALIDSISFKR